MSQPAVNTSAVLNSSSTMQLLSGCHSAPHPHAVQHVRVQLLQRGCGCTGDEECEECEGVRVTLSSASNLPLVTTPGPRPKPLTLEDLGACALVSVIEPAHAYNSTHCMCVCVCVRVVACVRACVEGGRAFLSVQHAAGCSRK